MFDESDEWLLARHLEGDPYAFKKLMARYRGLFERVLRRYGFDDSTREDLLQEISMRIHLNAHLYQPRDKLRAWVRTIADNTAKDYLSYQSAQKRAAKRRTIAPDTLAAPDPQPDDVLELNETLRMVAATLAELRPHQRRAYVLHTKDGRTQSEVADILGMPLNTVKTHIRRTRWVLAKAHCRHKLK